MLTLWAVSATTGKSFSSPYLQHLNLGKAFAGEAEVGFNTKGQSKKGVMKVGW